MIEFLLTPPYILMENQNAFGKTDDINAWRDFFSLPIL